MAEGLDDEYKVESKGKNDVTELLLYASVICTKIPIGFSYLYTLAYIILMLFFCNLLPFRYSYTISNPSFMLLKSHYIYWCRQTFFITSLFRWKNKRKGFHIPPTGVYVDIWMQAVAKSSSVLGNICLEAILSEESSP